MGAEGESESESLRQKDGADNKIFFFLFPESVFADSFLFIRRRNMLDFLTKVVGVVNDVVWGWPVIILILGTGLLLTIRTKFLQLRKFGDSMGSTIVPTIKSLGKKKSGDRLKTVSQFEAFATAISGTVGTGNIIGVTAAILAGGPGAVFWMWVTAFFGMVTNYAENVLGHYYRKKEKDGSLSGGAFYYIAYGLKWKWLAYFASVFCMVAAVGMSGVQANKITGTLSNALGEAFKIDFEASPAASTLVKLLIGIIIALLAAVIIIGGIKRIGKVASNLVPVMSVLFIVLAFVTIFMNIKAVPTAFSLIFTKAFNFKAAGGGLLGCAFSQTIKKGMARGVFSNEAGLGSSVIAHSASESREPVKQGLWGVFEVFFDTFVICTLSALMFLVTFDLNELTGTEVDSVLSTQMFSQNFGTFGVIAFSIILPLFAFTTILAWSYYGEKATEFTFKWLGEKGSKVAVLVFKIFYVVMIVCSALISSGLIWDIDDAFNGLMAIPNLICVIALSGVVAKITKNYYDRKKGKDVEPMLSAYPEMNEEFKKDIASGDEEKI